MDGGIRGLEFFGQFLGSSIDVTEAAKSLTSKQGCRFVRVLYVFGHNPPQ